MRTYGANSKPIQQHFSRWGVAKRVITVNILTKRNGTQKCADII